MATRVPIPTPSRVVQVVGREQHDRVFKKLDLKGLIDSYCNEPKGHYTVFSIIGAQSSGKSTLMNTMFKTRFQMLNQRTEGRQATTKGIWAAICNDPRAIVLDIEGSDGEDHQDDPEFENHCALFALVISDVIFFNINLLDIGRMHAASIPLLRTIFQERLSQQMHTTKLVFTIRDYNNEVQTPERDLRERLFSTLNQIWDNLTATNGSTLGQYFELSVEFFPHYDYRRDAFERKCEDMIDGRPEFYNGPNNWSIDTIPTLAEELWKSIRENERLDMPSNLAMASRERCEVIMSRKISSLPSNEDYQSFTNGEPMNPSAFHAKLQRILDKILSEYDDEAQIYDTNVACKVKDALSTEILKRSEPLFRKVINKFRIDLCDAAADEIQLKCNQTLKTTRKARSVASDYAGRFMRETQDIKLYSIEADQQNFNRDIDLIGKSLAKAATVKHIRDFAIIMKTTLGVASMVGGAILGGDIVAGLSSLTVAEKGVDQLAESEVAYERSARETLLKVLEEGDIAARLSSLAVAGKEVGQLAESEAAYEHSAHETLLKVLKEGDIAAELSSLVVAGKGVGQLAKSKAAYERSASETLLKVLEEGEDDTDEPETSGY